MNSFPVRNGPSLKKVRVLFISRKFVVIALVLSKKTFKYGECILTRFAITFISLWKWILPFIEQTKNSLHLRPGPTAQPLADEKGIQNVKKKAPPPRRKTSVVYSLRSAHQASVHCDFIRVKTKLFERIHELSAVYGVNL